MRKTTAAALIAAGMAALAINAVRVTDAHDAPGRKPCREAAPDERCIGPSYKPRVSTPRPARRSGPSDAYTAQALSRATQLEVCLALNPQRPCECQRQARRFLRFDWKAHDLHGRAEVIRIGCSS